MNRWRTVAREVGLLVLRIPGAFLAFAHGWGKVAGLATGGAERFVEGVERIGFPFPLLFAWAAALSEFAGGLCVAVGLGARIGAAFAAITMAVAAFGAHAADPFGKKELALLYLVAFVAVVLLGPGALSIDHLLRGGRKE